MTPSPVPLPLLRGLAAAGSRAEVASLVAGDAVARLGRPWAGVYAAGELLGEAGVAGGPARMARAPGLYPTGGVPGAGAAWAAAFGTVAVVSIDGAHALAVAGPGGVEVDVLAGIAALAVRAVGLGGPLEEPTAPPAEEAPAARRMLLVVDDDDGIREVVRQAVDALGLATLGAATGEEGASMLAANAAAVDVVLLDLTLPDQPPDRVYAALRAVAPAVPVILCSGYGEGEARRLSRAGPDVRYLPKPFDLRQLVRTLAGAMR